MDRNTYMGMSEKAERTDLGEASDSSTYINSLGGFLTQGRGMGGSEVIRCLYESVGNDLVEVESFCYLNVIPVKFDFSA